MKNQTKMISRREREVLQLIAHELTTKEIAYRLFISEETVRSHRKNLMIKVKAKNTAGLIFKSMDQMFFSIDLSR